ncbi:MAG: InlB B-repeat-containing protein [Clostridia bacterium]|nr:InlB B-repeat-containing protein [Clostridia bacterium]
MKKMMQIILPIVLVSIILSSCQTVTMDENTDVIRMPSSYTEYDGENYQDVYRELKKLGFYDIEFVVIDDLITGWLIADGEVEYVSIDGDDSFRRGDEFEKDSQIVIAYHTFKSGTSSDTEQKPTEQTYFMVTFEENGGETVNDLTFKSGYEINIYQDIASSTRDGYVFLGWYFENGEEFPARYKIDKNISLVARWEKILPSEWEYAFQRDSQDYSIYYLFDVDTSRFVTFSTSDTYIGKGKFEGNIQGRSPVKLIYEDNSINEHEQFQNIGTYGILTDFNGYKWNYYMEPYPYRAERILNEINNQRENLGNDNGEIDNNGKVYDYAYYISIGEAQYKCYYLFDIDDNRFVYFETNGVYLFGDILYNSLIDGFKIGEKMCLYYDDPNYSEIGFDHFTPNEFEGVLSSYIDYEDPQYQDEWFDIGIFNRDFNVAEADRLLEEIKNN